MPLSWLTVAFALVAAQPPEVLVRSDQARLEGTWKVVAVKQLLAPHEVMQKKGKAWVVGPGLEAAERFEVKDASFTFKGDRLSIQASKQAAKRLYWFKECQYRIDPTKSPKALDLTPRDEGLEKDATRTFGAIYILDGDALWIADFEGNVDRPLSFDLSVGIAYPMRVLVLKRQRPAKMP